MERRRWEEEEERRARGRSRERREARRRERGHRSPGNELRGSREEDWRFIDVKQNWEQAAAAAEAAR
eukprot:gene11701-1061_t